MTEGADEDELEKKEHEEDERVQVAPNMGAGGSHPQAMTDPGEEDGKRKRWVDCDDEDDEGRQEGQEAEKEEERAGEREEVKRREKETGKEGRQMRKPPGLEDVESELKTTGEEEEFGCVENEQEARGKQREVQQAREEEQRRAQEASEAVRRAQEARVRQVRVAKAHEERGRARE